MDELDNDFFIYLKGKARYRFETLQGWNVPELKTNSI